MQPIQLGIGIDVGTSGVRAIALTHNEACIAQATRPITEQTPAHWWQQTLAAIDSLTSSLSAYASAHGLHWYSCAIAVDATSSSLFLQHSTTGEPISDVKMYYDAGDDALLSDYLASDHPACHRQSTLAKTRMLANTMPDDHWQVCHQADWINQQLGVALGITDENNVLKLGYDIRQRQWPSTLDSLLAPHHRPTKIVAPGTTIATLEPALATRWRLPLDTQIKAGTTDSIAALLATGASQLGDAVISLGSTMAFKLIAAHPIDCADSGIYSHRLGESWLIGGASNAGGAVLREYFNDEMLADLGKCSITPSLHLDYYPLPQTVTGERFPYPDAQLRTQLVPRPNSDDAFFQAILEGLVRIEAKGWQRLTEESMQAIQRLFALGGGTKNERWMHLRDQALPYPQQPTQWLEAAAGSARLALGCLTM